MPVLNKLVVRNFRNIALQELEFSRNLNCIWGNNGEGKTNLMDAIYYLSMTKSAFSVSDRYNFRHGENEFAIAGTYLMPSGLESRFSIQVTDGGEKKLRRDDKPCPRMADHIGLLPVVMVSPADISLVSESGEERRKFVNAVISQLDHSYLSAVQQYSRLLLQRNKLLKSDHADAALLDVIDARMESLSPVIHSGRQRFVSELSPIVREYYHQVSGGAEDVSIEYKSDLNSGSLTDVLRDHRSRDFAMRYTTAGLQRDDFIFALDGHPIRRCGSQGQQKSFLVSLKFAQYDIMKKSLGYAPSLLLDDLFDKLDMSRVSNLLQMVAGDSFGQIFLSDTNKVRISAIVDRITSDSAYFETVGGVFSRL